MTRPDGTPVNAVFGFTNMLAKLLREHVGTHLAVIFDAGRHDVPQPPLRRSTRRTARRRPRS